MCMRLNNINKYNRKNIKQIYESSFPKYERFDFKLLEKCAKESNVTFKAIIIDEDIIGIEFIINYDTGNNDDINYLMYFAIDEKYRNKGYGGQRIRELTLAGNILLAIERPIDKITQKRKNFYLRNGFYETGCVINDSGQEYEFLCSEQNLALTDEILRNRYLKMTSNKILMTKLQSAFDLNINIVTI